VACVCVSLSLCVCACATPKNKCLCEVCLPSVSPLLSKNILDGWFLFVCLLGERTSHRRQVELMLTSDTRTSPVFAVLAGVSPR
jgi:hypothetical protein